MLDVALVKKFLKMKIKNVREIQQITPEELNMLLANFILTVRQKGWMRIWALWSPRYD